MIQITNLALSRHVQDYFLVMKIKQTFKAKEKGENNKKNALHIFF